MRGTQPTDQSGRLDRHQSSNGYGELGPRSEPAKRTFRLGQLVAGAARCVQGVHGQVHRRGRVEEEGKSNRQVVDQP